MDMTGRVMEFIGIPPRVEIIRNLPAMNVDGHPLFINKLLRCSALVKTFVRNHLDINFNTQEIKSPQKDFFCNCEIITDT